ncbi:hypothetical protein P175DRAFT_0553296 [Aspergillus ochraceoroseus IBT 24754]|uniref:Uncharacterized protein n=1 Tax=Aspergillus ochraceoroseus IBT 24754 TaxID=1392256 RepID=A0A2T5M645_9EURO|nr:uncharacterized protein P175DRAFT_0553296 [Aspergillus ochraceoroseus IBT 24754]PTU24007.1 hypothetical protein P175DRAFT_0553296 [Aspergillus ochraceoroseus IBT 24754]
MTQSRGKRKNSEEMTGVAGKRVKKGNSPSLTPETETESEDNEATDEDDEDDEDEEEQEETDEEQILSREFCPSWFIPTEYRQSVSLKQIFACGFEIPSPPPEMPSWMEPVPRTVNIGLSLKPRVHRDNSGVYYTGPAYDAAILRVKFSPAYYRVTDVSGESLDCNEYLEDPLFNSELKILQLVVNIFEQHLGDLHREHMAMGEKMRDWRCKRREWEVGLVTQFKAKGLVDISNGVLTELNTWLRKENADDIGGKGDIWDHGDEFCPDNLPVLPPQHKTKRGPAHSAVPKRIDEVKSAITALQKKINSLQKVENRDPLLIIFDDEQPANNTITIPIPSLNDRDKEKFYNWCMERHGHWAKKGAFRKETAQEMYQLAELAQLRSEGLRKLPKGNLGLIPELVAYDEFLGIYPWGLPAAKLYAALEHAKLEQKFYNLHVRDYLLDLEEWYFRQAAHERSKLQREILEEWPLGEKLVGMLKALLKRSTIVKP